MRKMWFGTYSPPEVDRICGIRGSSYNIPKAMFYLLKGDNKAWKSDKDTSRMTPSQFHAAPSATPTRNLTRRHATKTAVLLQAGRYHGPAWGAFCLGMVLPVMSSHPGQVKQHEIPTMPHYSGQDDVTLAFSNTSSNNNNTYNGNRTTSSNSNNNNKKKSSLFRGSFRPCFPAHTSSGRLLRELPGLWQCGASGATLPRVKGFRASGVI